MKQVEVKIKDEKGTRLILDTHAMHYDKSIKCFVFFANVEEVAKNDATAIIPIDELYYIKALSSDNSMNNDLVMIDD